MHGPMYIRYVSIVYYCCTHARTRIHTHVCVYEIKCSCGDECKYCGRFGCHAVQCGEATLCHVSED